MFALFTAAFALLALPGQEGAPTPDSSAKPTVDQQVAAEAAAIRAAVDAWLAGERDVHSSLVLDGRLALWSDFASGVTREAAKRSGGVLARIDRAFGAPEDPAAAVLVGVMLEDGARYRSLCDAVAAAAPAQQGFMEASKATTGFTLYAPPLTVYFHDPAIQDEARPDHSVAHSLVHLEMWRRFGPLPLWLTEGLACAGEDGAWGEVWAYWYRDGFVFTKEHADWRGKQTQKIVKELADLRGLFAYPARPFEQNRALLAFAFATYGLDAEPKPFAAFVAELRVAYQKHNPQGGRPELPPADVEAMLLRAFGDDFLTRFQKWWKKPPKWSAKPAA